MKKTYQITEYSSFARGKNITGYTYLPNYIFGILEEFILSNKNRDVEALEFMNISVRKGIGKVITAKNYVGIIEIKDGINIEILPKIYSQEDVTEAKVKKLVMDMLKTLRKSPYKSLQVANVSVDKMNIFEIFIRMFINEVLLIVKKGLKSNYETIESNERVFKGKMKFAQQIKYNYAHKEQSYVEYDEFNTNCPENKLLKSTLLYLYKNTHSLKNKNDIKMLLNSFLEVEKSINYEDDFNRIIAADRNKKDYTTALLWSKIFLMGKSFTSFSGSKIAFVLLFPMENLFESYVAEVLRRNLNKSAYNISIQDKTHHLFDEPNKKFLLKPDIVVKNKKDNNIVILDTKWKLLSGQKSNYGIPQSDMYQMYAYSKKYGAENVILLYPNTEKIIVSKPIEFKSKDGISVKVRFIDLFNIKESINQLIIEL